MIELYIYLHVVCICNFASFFHGIEMLTFCFIQGISLDYEFLTKIWNLPLFR